MIGHREFQAAILANPGEDGPWLVYADWLEEERADQRAEAIRGHIRLRQQGSDLLISPGSRTELGQALDKMPETDGPIVPLLLLILRHLPVENGTWWDFAAEHGRQAVVYLEMVELGFMRRGRAHRIVDEWRQAARADDNYWERALLGRVAEILRHGCRRHLVHAAIRDGTYGHNGTAYDSWFGMLTGWTTRAAELCAAAWREAHPGPTPLEAMLQALESSDAGAALGGAIRAILAETPFAPQVLLPTAPPDS